MGESDPRWACLAIKQEKPPALGYSPRTILAIVLSCMNEVPS